MKIFNKFNNTRGFISEWQDVLRWAYMITDKAKHRYRVLVFWEKYGLEPTIEAFKIKRRTLFNWKRIFNEGGRKVETLNGKSKAPRTRRKRIWPVNTISEIRRLRIEHPNLGKEKLYPELKEFCDKKRLICPKPKTIGRIIADLGGLRMFPRKVSHFGKIKKLNRQKVIRNLKISK